ncbi:nitrous oxide reductase accessory protein NosL [Ideonella sp. TBM-1]|uniref:Nitrous oxide reductase accessory protein NosL n=2 Tax=Ideonella livida TaxID=2707176 RepID=A0A7C9PJJ7_9BURK|nr:nitrous oxide reductase accessory protein NosL [Ideonella livida]
MPVNRRRWLCGCASLAALALAGCGKSEGEAATVAARDFAPHTSCSLDGMLLADYPGPKGQILYRGTSEPAFFCDTVELLSSLIKPEQVRPVAGAWVQDMARTDWDRPAGAWIEARSAHFVLGSRRHGSMGPTAASFASADAAQAFAQQWGGKVVAYAQITPEQVDLSGGALHDSRM